MSQTPQRNLIDLGNDLRSLLAQLKEALKDDATLDTQRRAFQLGCNFMTELVASLGQDGSELANLEAQVAGFEIGIADDQFDQFLLLERRLLEHMKLEPDHIERALASLKDLDKQELKAYRLKTVDVLKPLSELQDTLCKMEGWTAQMRQGYLFSWDEIPGKGSGIFIDILKQHYGVDWIKPDGIKKIDDDKTIRVSNEKHFLSLKLNNDKTEINLKIDDIRSDKFVVKIENGKLNIYMQWKVTTELIETCVDAVLNVATIIVDIGACSTPAAPLAFLNALVSVRAGLVGLSKNLPAVHDFYTSARTRYQQWYLKMMAPHLPPKFQEK